jgi:hypothetical protein
MCIHAASCAQLHQTLPLCQSELCWCHVSSGSGPHLPTREGSGATMCTVARDPASLLGRAPVRHYLLRHLTLPPCWDGSDAVTCPTAPCGPRASSIKKNLDGIPK